MYLFLPFSNKKCTRCWKKSTKTPFQSKPKNPHLYLVYLFLPFPTRNVQDVGKSVYSTVPIQTEKSPLVMWTFPFQERTFLQVPSFFLRKYVQLAIQGALLSKEMKERVSSLPYQKQPLPIHPMKSNDYHPPKVSLLHHIRKHTLLPPHDIPLLSHTQTRTSYLHQSFPQTLLHLSSCQTLSILQFVCFSPLLDYCYLPALMDDTVRT